MKRRSRPQSANRRKNQPKKPAMAISPPDNNDYKFQPLQFVEVDAEPKGGGMCPLRSPEPRSGHRSVCNDANLFSFGGYAKTNSVSLSPHRLYEELWCFNFAERRWKLLPTIGTPPKELASHCATLYGNYLHVFGGTGVSFGESTSNKLTCCDLRSLEWKEITTSGQPPDPQYGQALFLDETKKHLYVIGGTTGFEFTMDIHRLNLATKTWELIYLCKGDDPSEPPARYRHEIAFDGTTIYVFGGGLSTNAFSLRVVPAFDVETRKWSMLKTIRSRIGRSSSFGEDSPGYPSSRKCHTSVQIGEDVYICGGCREQKVFDDIWRFHIPSRQWEFIQIRMPVPLAFHTACVTPQGCMYVFGGVTDIERSERTNKIFKIWLKIPKLKEICWEALLSTNPSIRKSPREKLVDLGIPSDFVNRVHPAPPGGKPEPNTESIWESDFLKVGSNHGSCSRESPTQSNCNFV